MSTMQAPHRPSTAGLPFNLAMVGELIRADPVVPLPLRKRLLSGLNMVARGLDRPLADVPASPEVLNALLKGISPVMARVKPSTWRNAKSNTRSALQHVGLATMPGRRKGPLSPSWAELLGCLTDRYQRFALSRFSGYCSANGIEPAAVTDAAMTAFADAMQTAGVINKPRMVHRNACLAWNKAVAAIPAWPKTALTMPNYSRNYTLPWSAFPASFRVDVDAYLHRQAGTDLLNDIDLRRPLRPASVQTRLIQLRAFASVLLLQGIDPNGLRTLADLVALDAVKLGLRWYLERGDGNTTTSQISALIYVLKSVAEHWVGVPPDHLKRLQIHCRKLTHTTDGLTAKNRERLRQFDDPANVQALLRMPPNVFAEAAKKTALSAADLLELQAALAVEILEMVPIRIGNLANLDLDRHLFRGRNGIYTMFIPAYEVKNNAIIEAVLPELTSQLLDLYISHYRPRPNSGSARWLFPGVDGKAKTTRSLRIQMTNTIMRRCGLVMHPHLFRHLAAKLWLAEHPGDYGTLRLLFGHKSTATTTKFYCGAETPAAMRHFDKLVLKLRDMPVPIGAKGWAPHPAMRS